jgi:hypothetical protein
VNKLVPAKLDKSSDGKTIAQARRNLITPNTWQRWLQFFAPTATRALVSNMKRAKLSWLELDDLTYELDRDVRDEPSLVLPSKVYVVTIEFNHELSSDVYTSAKVISEKIAALTKSGKYAECTVVVYGRSGNSWQQLVNFRKELMGLVKAQFELTNLVFSSLTCHPERVNSRQKAKLAAEVASRYYHWLLNHRQRLALKLIK